MCALVRKGTTLSMWRYNMEAKLDEISSQMSIIASLLVDKGGKYNG